jgi:hypothetical protein
MLNAVAATCIRYGKINNQPEFYGSFGEWSILMEVDEREVNKVFEIYKIVIKIGNGEHSIKPFMPCDYLGEV